MDRFGGTAFNALGKSNDVDDGKPTGDNAVSTFVELSSNTPISSIAPFVDEATRDLFATFQGERILLNVIEDWTSQLVERRLGR
jgi:hypothetical protein